MKSPKMLKHAENWYVLWEIEFDPHTGCTSVRPSPAAWHALVLLPKRDECRRDASPANLKSQVVSVVSYGSWHFLNISSNFLHCLSTYMIMYVPCFLPFESRPGGLCARIAFSLPWLGDERHAKDHRRLRNSQRSSFRHTSSSKYPWGGTLLDQIWERFLTFSLQRSNKIQGLFCCMTIVTSRISSSSVTYYKEPSNDEMTLILSTLQSWERKLSAQLSASVLYRTGILLSSSGSKVPRTNNEPLTLKGKGLKFWSKSGLWLI